MYHTNNIYTCLNLDHVITIKMIIEEPCEVLSPQEQMVHQIHPNTTVYNIVENTTKITGKHKYMQPNYFL